MRLRNIHLTNENKDYISFKTVKTGKTNSADRARMKKFLNMAIDKELTEKQKHCLTEYFFNGKRMYIIAKEMNLNPSTVTRHIKAAQKRLKNIASYYESQVKM